MSRHLPLLATITICLVFMICHVTITNRVLESEPSGRGTPNLKVKVKVKPEDKPDFAAITPVSKRKKAFFAFMDKYIAIRNQEILALRTRIENNALEDDEWQQLAERYRIRSDEPEFVREQLLLKVDTLPASLVKAQAAMESAWGTSRFAVEGNNYFGQWCFRAGCGLIPESRGEDKDHEVRVFESPQASVNSYMLNLNSHRAYRQLRKARAELRQQRQTLNGCYLAMGLEHYSEKGARYVESLKKLIRVNKLEQDATGHCAPVMVAAEDKVGTTPAGDAPQPKEIAVDDTQGRITPQLDARSPPSS